MSKQELTISNKLQAEFGELIYNAIGACGDKLFWELNPDPDILYYFAECCGKRYEMWPSLMTCRVSAITEEEELTEEKLPLLSQDINK